MTEPGYALYSRCSRYVKCSVNCCPLDPLAEKRLSVPGDPEQTCKALLGERLGLAKEAPGMGLRLCWGGFTQAEDLRVKSGEATADEIVAEQEAMALSRHEQALKAGARLRASKGA